jgi:hypothetical protein
MEDKMIQRDNEYYEDDHDNDDIGVAGETATDAD